MRWLAVLTLMALIIAPQYAIAQDDRFSCESERRAHAARIVLARKISPAAGATEITLLARMEMDACKNPNRAVREFERAIALDQAYVTARAGRCTALLKASRAEEAIEECSRAIKLNPNHVAALEIRGDAYRRLGRLLEALEDYEQVAEMLPDASPPVIKRAKLYLDLNRLEDAAVEVRRSSARTDANNYHSRSEYGGDEEEKRSVTELLYDKHRADPKIAPHLPPLEVAAFLYERARKESTSGKALGLINESISWLSDVPKRELETFKGSTTKQSILEYRAALLLQADDIPGAERDFEDAARAFEGSSSNRIRWEAATSIAGKLRSKSGVQAVTRLMQTALEFNEQARSSLTLASVTLGAFLAYAEIASVHGRTALATNKSVGATDCDRIAGHQLDAWRVVDGKLLNSIDAERAITACSADLRTFESPRLRMQRGIGYLRKATAQTDKGQQIRAAQLMAQDLSAAAAANYPAANMLLSHAVDIDLVQPQPGMSKTAYAYDLNILALNQVLNCCAMALIRAMQDEAGRSGNPAIDKAAFALLVWAARLGSSEAHIALAEREVREAGDRPLTDTAAGQLLSHVAIARKIKPEAEIPPHLVMRVESATVEAPTAVTYAAAEAAAWSPMPSNKPPPWLRVPAH